MNNSEFAKIFIAIIYTIIPAQISEKIPFFELDKPFSAENFGTVFPIITWLDIVIFIYLLTYLFNFKKYLNKFDLINVYIFISLICISLNIFDNNFDYKYYDGHILFVKTLLLYFVWIVIDKKWRYHALIITIFIASIVGILSFYSGILYSERLNLPGFEVTSSAYLVGLMILLSIVLYKKLQMLSIATVGLFALMLTGSRFPLVILFMILIFTLLFNSNIKAYKKILILILILILMTVSYIIQINLSRSDSIGLYESVKDTFKIFISNEISDSVDINSSSLTGRLIAVMAGGSVCYDNFPIPLFSDWLIQEKLLDYGYPSHTHMGLLQILIKYGIFSFIYLLCFCKIIYRKIYFKTKFYIPLLFISTSLIFDYVFFVPAMNAIFFILANSEDIKNKRL